MEFKVNRICCCCHFTTCHWFSDFLKHFINPVEGNVSLEKCTQILSVSEQIAKLSEGIDNLNRELQKQVSENHDDLLFHASWIEKLEDVLEMMSANMQVLHVSKDGSLPFSCVLSFEDVNLFAVPSLWSRKNFVTDCSALPTNGGKIFKNGKHIKNTEYIEENHKNSSCLT